MKAIMRSKYGSPDVLELLEINKPDPMDNQVLVRVHAAAVNPLDWHILRGEPFLVRLMGFGLLKPKHQILGADMAGRVEAVGKNVIQFKSGDEVFGSSMGGFAEYACVREDKLVLKPAAITFEQAAAVPVACPIAMQETVFLVDMCALRSEVIIMPETKRFSIPFTHTARYGIP